MSFCVWTKVSKNIIDTLLIIFKLLFFLSFIILCFWICFFMHDIQKHLLFFYVLISFFGKYLVSYVVVPLFLSKKKITSNKKVTLFIFLYFLKLFLTSCYSLSFVSYLSCLLSLLLVFLFSTLFLFFLLFFSFHVTSPSVCLSLCLFTLSLFYASSVYSFFFQKITFHLFGFQKKKRPPFSFVHPFLQNCFCFFSFVVSHLFLICFCFFNRVLSNKRNWPFFLVAEKPLI